MRTSFPERFNYADYCLFDRLGEGLGDKDALLYGDYRYSYRDIADRARALARYVVNLGVAREQRIYIVLPDAPPFAWSIFGTLASGCVLAMGNPHAPADALAGVVDYTRAAVVITTVEAAGHLAPALAMSRELRGLLLVPDVATGEDPEGLVGAIPDAITKLRCEVKPLTEAIAQGRALELPLPETYRDDPCAWLFTSGSTGRAKAAIHTHRDFAFNNEVYAKGTVGYRREDICVSVPRLFFGYATGTNLWFPFSVGATVGLFSERPTPQSLSSAVARYQATVVTNVPTMLGKLLDYDRQRIDDGHDPVDFSSVRFQLSAGEALPPALLSKVLERFACDVYDGIGSAEMFHIYASNRPGDIKPGSLGKVVDGYELKILPQDAETPGVAQVPVGDIGVLWVRGDSVAIAYHQDRDKSWRTFHGRWCRTGDLFRIDSDGYLWFVGRADDLFKVGGIWVSPIEVEDCLISHAAVSIAAVVPVTIDGLLKPKAYVVLRQGGASETLAQELKDYVKSKLSKHTYPREVEFVDDLPRNDRGKIDRKALRIEAGQ